MKKILLLSVFISCIATSFSQSYRYKQVPEDGTVYCLNNKEITVVPYASTITLAPIHELAVFNVASLTGNPTINISIANSFFGDRVTVVLSATSTTRTVTWGSNIVANGATASVTTTVPIQRNFIFNGTKWIDGSIGVAGSSGLFGAGTVGAPSISFSAQSDLGFYKVSASQIGFSSGGTLVGGINGSGLFTSQITEQVTGAGVTFPKETFQGRTATTFTVSHTIGADSLIKGAIAIASGTCTITLPTGTALTTQTGATTGYTFDVVLDNSASGGTLTIAVNTNIVAASAVTGGTTLTLANSASAGSGTLRFTKLAATNAWTVSRIQ